jgi:long-chain acyl-CoA synthetase
MRLVHKYLHTGARLNPRKPSLECDGRTLSYAEMIDAIDAIADVLIVEGIRKGDTVLVLVHGQLDLLISLYAVMRAGAVAVPVPGDCGTDVVAEMARRCSPEALITSRADLRRHTTLADLLRCPFMLADSILETMRQEETDPDQDSLVESFDRFDRVTKMMNITDADGAIRCFSGKADVGAEQAYYTHRQLVTTAMLVNKQESLNGEQREFITARFSDVAGLQRALCMHIAGGTVISTDHRGDISGIAAAVIESNCNSLAVTAREIDGMIAQPIPAPLRSALLQIDVSGGLAAATAKTLLDLFPAARIFLHRDYPASPYATLLNLRKQAHKLETVGKTLGEVSIGVSDEHGKLLARPRIGEVVIRAAVQPGVTGKNRRQSSAAGWQRTGDIGYLDREGFLHIVAEQFEMITVNGVSFSPLKMEERVRTKFGGCEVGIVGVPDPAGLLGEIPVFCYHPLNGTKITSADLSLLLSKEFDQYQIPRIICRMDKFPRRGTIIMREELRRNVLTALADPQHHVQPKHVQQ